MNEVNVGARAESFDSLIAQEAALEAPMLLALCFRIDLIEKITILGGEYVKN